MVEEDLSLCGSCWRDTVFIRGLRCRSCGVPLPGEDDGTDLRCDDCMRIARPWSRGAAALLYSGNGRRLVMAFKHGDRTELAKPAAKWMLAAMPDILPSTLVIPVPLHWRRFLKRRFNQAAVLARHIAREADLPYLPDALLRHRATKPLDGHRREARFKALEGAIKANPKHAVRLDGQRVLLIDDVLTTGATLATCTEVCMAAGADHVDVLTLARVAKAV